METSTTQPKPQTQAKASKPKRVASRKSDRNDNTGMPEFDPKLLWITVRRCWPWATPVGMALAAIAAFVIYSRFVPIYQATHLLESNQDFVLFQGVMPTSKNLANTEKQLIFTDLVLDSVIASSEVQQSPGFADAEAAKGSLRQNLSIGNAGVDSLLTISFKHPDPKVAALVCNKVTESYLTQRERLDNERVSNLESWLAPSIDLWKEEAQNHEKRVRELTKTTLGYDPTQRVESIENDLSVLVSLRSNLASLVAEESILEARIAMANANEGSAPISNKLAAGFKVPEPTSAELREFVDNDPEVAKLRALWARKQEQVQSIEDRGMTGIRQEYYRELKDQLATHAVDLKRAEDAAQKKAPEVLKKIALEAYQREHSAKQADMQVASEVNRQQQLQSLAELKAKRAIMQQEYDLEKSRLEQQGGNAADLRFAQEDREIAAGILAQLNQRVAAIRTERRRGSGVHTLAAATPPSKPIEPIPLKHMGIGALGGFVLPFLLGLLFEFRLQRISDVSTLESKPIAPVVGEVARIPSRVGGNKRHRVFEESIDTLRANLMLAKETSGVRSVTIASSMSGEGKSSVASQLAISIAKACGKTVLIIDADLRSPDQHDIFGLEMGPGLTKVLSGQSSLSDAIDRSLGDLIHVLPAGRMDQSPHRLLNASALRDLLDQALSEYAYIVVDTAPVLAAGETLAVASETDATLICVMRDLSRVDTVVRCTRRLEAAGANVVGTVFSGVPSSHYAYRYGDYRYLQAGRPS